MSDRGIFRRDAHQEAEELLPWYATGQLDEADRIKVEHHLSSCSECREQLRFERRVVKDIRSSSPETDAGWARLRGRIEDKRAPPQYIPRSPAGVWRFVRQPAVAALAAAQVG